jgi:Rap1a immunity proteins
MKLEYRAILWELRRCKPPMRYARILSIGLVATLAFAWSATAVENAHELAGYCRSLERGAKSAGRHIYIPATQEALTCWGYMQGMQDLSVLADEEGHRIMGACPPEQTTTLQLIRSFVRYARAHRSELVGNAVVAVFRALREAYPCPAEHGRYLSPRSVLQPRPSIME